MIKYCLIIILFLFVCQISFSQNLKKVNSKEEYCKILNHLKNMDLEDEAEEIRKLGYEPATFIEFGMMHPEALIEGYCQGEPSVELKDPGPLELECNIIGLKQEFDYSFGYNPWVSVSVSDLKLISKNEGSCIITFTNNKDIFLELIGTGGVNYDNTVNNGLLLFPKESIRFPYPLKFHIYCDKDYYIRFEFNFSRGEFIGMTKSDFINCSGIMPGAFLFLISDCIKKQNIGYSNNAIKFSVIDLFWTAMFGERLKRDAVENGINAILGLLDLCPECDEIVFQYFGSRKIIPDLYKLSRNISPQNLISFIIKISIVLLENPSTQKAAFNILSKYLPAAITSGGASVLAKNLSTILLSGARVLALAPIAYDVWDTQKVESRSAIKITPIIKYSIKKKSNK